MPSIHAIGDVTDRINADAGRDARGHGSRRHALRRPPDAPDHEDVPAGVFSQPTVGAVGLTEAQARERIDEIDVYRTRFRR